MKKCWGFGGRNAPAPLLAAAVLAAALAAAGCDDGGADELNPAAQTRAAAAEAERALAGAEGAADLRAALAMLEISGAVVPSGFDEAAEAEFDSVKGCLAGLLAALRGTETEAALAEALEALNAYLAALCGRSAVPKVEAACAAKESAASTGAAFTVTSTHSALSVWKVYDDDVLETESARVAASFSAERGTLLLSSCEQACAISAGTWYVTVTEPGKSESERLALTVTEADGGATEAGAGAAEAGAGAAEAGGGAGDTAYTITYHFNGGSGSGAASYTAAGGPVILFIPARAGYTFLGWYDNEGLGGEAVTTIPAGSAGNREFWARWSSAASYVISYHLNGGAGQERGSYTVDAAFTLPTDAARTGYAFAGWYDNSALSGAPVRDIPPGSVGEKVFWAKWRANTYTVTFDTCGAGGFGAAEGASKAVTYDGLYGEMPEVSWAGRAFLGWFTAANGGTEVTASTVVAVAAAQTLYAHWAAERYAVTYYLNGGSGPESGSYTVEAPLTLPSPSKTGYTFAGWYGSSAFTGSPVAAIPQGATGERAFWAKWTANTYTVAYNANGGALSGGTAAGGVAYGEVVTLPSSGTKAGHTLSGFTLSGAAAGVYKPGAAFTMPAGVVTAAANWTVNTYLVTFNEAGGGTPSPASMTVTYGAAYGPLATVSRTGYTFAGWFTAESGGTRVTASTVVAITAAQTLYAGWTVDTYTITYHLNGGSGAREGVYTIESAAITLPTPTRDGSVFAGWYETGDFTGEVVTTIHQGSTGNKTFYALWLEAYAFTTPGKYREMVAIPAMVVTGSGSSGVFVANRTVSLSAYKIARYETIYELWYEVKTWAKENGYTFTNEGREGHDGMDGAPPTSAAKSEPVTCVTWQDVIVWCNAYSEMEGRALVYYSDAGYSAEIRSLSDNTVYMKAGTNGYRLPTETEWEAAARGGDPSAAAWSYTYAGSNFIDAVACYHSSSQITSTSPVGGKAANTAGLYDMSGNVWEWCFDWTGNLDTGEVMDPTGAAEGTSRAIRGGSWVSAAYFCVVADRNYFTPEFRNGYLGFRVVCP